MVHLKTFSADLHSDPARAMLHRPVALALYLLGMTGLCHTMWVNFDTWESRKSYDQLSHYEYPDYNYRNPLFTNEPLLFHTLEPTTPTLTPRFFKRNFLKFRRFWNDTLNKYQVREKFKKFDKHGIIRSAARHIQRFLYLNAPEERVSWFYRHSSSAIHEVCTYKGELPWHLQTRSTKAPRYK
ncbi:hypothetical protein M8J75_005834 [Diaphorina citri]|nr:hypothetical protein M8J75_005834 [Diaphorina citri]